MKKHLFITLIAIVVFIENNDAQLPVEIFGGDKKATIDVLFFRYIKNKQKQNSKFLFFNRNRASYDYKQTPTTNLPAFGFTEAVSFNMPKLKGFAPVVLVQIFNTGLVPKAGIQYYYGKKPFTFFSWIVMELKEKSSTDWFVLTRYEPKISNTIHLFSQLELLNTFPSSIEKNYNFVQRVRLGIRLNELQFGAGGDFQRQGRNFYVNTTNIGAFVRYEF